MFCYYRLGFSIILGYNTLVGELSTLRRLVTLWQGGIFNCLSMNLDAQAVAL